MNDFRSLRRNPIGFGLRRLLPGAGLTAILLVAMAPLGWAATPNLPNFVSVPSPAQLYPSTAPDALNGPYSVVVDFTDPDGAANLKNAYLRLKGDGPVQTIMVENLASTPSPSQWAGEGSHLTNLSASKTTITNGHRVTFSFQLKSTWTPSTNVDFEAWSLDAGDAVSTHQTYDWNGRYDLIVTPGQPSFINTPSPARLDPYKSCTVVVDYTDPGGATNLQNVYLQVRGAGAGQTIMYENLTSPSQWAGEGNHLLNFSASKTAIANGYRVTFSFRIKETWTASTNVDFEAWSLNKGGTVSAHRIHDWNGVYDPAPWLVPQVKLDPGNGIWIYGSSVTAGGEAALAAQLAGRAIKHVFVFDPGLTATQYAKFTGFIQEAHALGLTVHAVCHLSGTLPSAAAVQNSIDQVLDYNSANSTATFDGIQIDVENVSGQSLYNLYTQVTAPPALVLSAAVQEGASAYYNQLLQNTHFDLLIPMIYAMDGLSYSSGNLIIPEDFPTIQSKTSQTLASLGAKGQIMTGFSSFDRELIVPRGFTGSMWDAAVGGGSAVAFHPSYGYSVPASVAAGRALESTTYSANHGASVYRFTYSATQVLDVVEPTPICVRRSIAAAAAGGSGNNKFVGACAWVYSATFDPDSRRDEGFSADDASYPAPQLTVQVLDFTGGIATLRVTLSNANPAEFVLGSAKGLGVHLRVEGGTFQSAVAGGFHATGAFDSSGNPLGAIAGSNIIELTRSFFTSQSAQTAVSGDIRVAASSSFTLRHRSWMLDKDSLSEESGTLQPYLARSPDDIHYDNPSRFLTLNTRSLTVSPNSAPTDIALSNDSIAEHQPVSTVVGTLSTTDPDAGNTFTYTLVSGTGSEDNSAFAINGDSLLTALPFDHEIKSAYHIRIRSTDQDGLWFEKTCSIQIQNIAETPIQLIAPTLDANGRFVVTLQGHLGQILDIQASTDLIHWDTIATLTNLTGTLHFSDPATADFDRRYYRVATKEE